MSTNFSLFVFPTHFKCALHDIMTGRIYSDRSITPACNRTNDVELQVLNFFCGVIQG